MTQSIHDVVYILRNNIVNPSELVYSLRSLDNFQHGDVWFAGGIPRRVKPDKAIPIEQKGLTKWERTTFTLRKVCECPDVSNPFYLFNDDFFILKPTDHIPYMYESTIEERVKVTGITSYTKQLQQTADELKRRGLSVNNYALHVPMLIDKDKALEVIDTFEGFPMFRCLYGNYWNVGGINAHDVKIHENNKNVPDDADFVSTNDTSFMYGKVGQYLRRTFPTKCKYEL